MVREMPRGRRHAGALVLLLALAAGGCRGAQSHYEAGLAYEKAGKTREAVLEYLNAVDKDPALADAQEHLGNALIATGDAGGGLKALIRAADLKSDDVDLQVRVGQQLLRRGQFDQARARADKALAKAPGRADAIVIRANALAGLTSVDEAISELKAALAVDPQATLFTSLGFVQMVKGNRAEAEAAFTQAVKQQPKSIEARLSLAHFQWSSGQTAPAEATLRAALALDPKHVLANRALAMFLLSTNRAREAEAPLQAVAGATGRSADRLDLADYYLATSRLPDALAQLDLVEKDPPSWAAARSRRALIEASQGHIDTALATIDAVLVRQPRDGEALMTKARVLLAANRPAEAEPALRTAIESDSRNQGARYLLGTVLASTGRFDEARAAFDEVLRLNPRTSAALVQIARLELLRGQPGASIQAAGQALQTTPDNATARLILVRGHLANRELQAAEQQLMPLVQAFPKSPTVLVELGRLRLAQGTVPAARTAFAGALAAQPASVEALTGLVAADVHDGKLDAADTRVANRLKTSPDDGRLLLLAARVALARRDAPTAEARLLKAIEKAPSNFDAYQTLGGLYLRQGKLDAAKAEFEALAAKQPKPVGPLTMLGIIAQAQGKPAEARTAYEGALKIDRRAPVAANNLAWMYAESGGDLAAALDLAQTAKAAFPSAGEVNDTLGFVYLKREVPSLAVDPLKQAVAADPGNPGYRYRFAQALAGAGQAADAKRELETLLARHPNFPQAEDARRLLGTLR